jgi:hypothetical protein
VLLSIIMVGQNVQAAADKRAEATDLEETSDSDPVNTSLVRWVMR